ncbi:hypothetical protein GCM10010324_05430 [Streptomyces hiroshimensis]|uniref:Uncharacterized protein n=1 Tax=Streptomyces hiroshimensis TaxID=66424 RepID=A0ABQ2Y5A6_9ACTN|nr:hypothetical protein GCM10010324_05430 [Streptomyces hiroshimensis]
MVQQVVRGGAVGSAVVRGGAWCGDAAPVGALGVPVTQASGRTTFLWGQPAHDCCRLRAGRPDTDNVWHRVPHDKTLGANNFSQMSSGRHV